MIEDPSAAPTCTVIPCGDHFTQRTKAGMLIAFGVAMFTLRRGRRSRFARA
jgi:hypothetical protein